LIDALAADCEEDLEAIGIYLAQNYGKPPAK
jgi:hypothetical protein